MKKPVIVILSGGAALGLAHIGVLAAIEKRFRISGIIGCSMGAIVGGLYCCGHNPQTMLNFAADFRQRDVFNPLNLDLNLSGIFDGKTTLKKLRQWTNDADISSAVIPYIAVAYDLNSASTILIDKGSFADAMRASSSVPYIYAPYSCGDYLFVDGGVEHPLPIAMKNEIPAEGLCIAVNVLPKVDLQVRRISSIKCSKAKQPKPRSHQVFLQSAMQNQGFVAMQSIINHKPDIVIEAWHPSLSVFDFEKADEFYEFGYTAALKALDSYSEPDMASKLIAGYQALLERISIKK